MVCTGQTSVRVFDYNYVYRQLYSWQVYGTGLGVRVEGRVFDYHMYIDNCILDRYMVEKGGGDGRGVRGEG